MDGIKIDKKILNQKVTNLLKPTVYIRSNQKYETVKHSMNNSRMEKSKVLPGPS